MILQSMAPRPAGEKGRWVAHFGGSFNPVHEGHTALARLLLERYGFDEVIFCPNGSAYPKSGLAPEADRLALLEAALRGEPRFSLCTFEMGRPERVNTLETLRFLRERLDADHPGARLFSVRGVDAVEAMTTWKSLPELCRLATFLVMPREGRSGEELFSGKGRLSECADGFRRLDSGGIPPVSSTLVRRLLLTGRLSEAPVAPAVREEIRRRGLYGLTAPGEAWVTLARPGYSGKAGAARDRLRDAAYGPGNWRTAFAWCGGVIRYEEARQLYEDAYLEHFRSHPEDLDWLTAAARDVFDNSETNVLSGLNYDVQEAPSTHLQDIAIRRCLMRLGLSFRGDHLVEVRGADSEGYRLNPGQVAFHRPDLILRPEPRDWWGSGSVEAFWQSNKVLQVREKVFDPDHRLTVHLALKGPGDTLLVSVEAGRVTSLPAFTYVGGTPFTPAFKGFLGTLAMRADGLAPVLGEPVSVTGGCHAVFTGEAAGVNAGFAMVPVPRVHSELKGRPVKDLLRLALKEGL